MSLTGKETVEIIGRHERAILVKIDFGDGITNTRWVEYTGALKHD